MSAPAVDSVCAHCGLPVRAKSADAAGAPLFCCLGCRLASQVARGKDGKRRFLEARLLLSAFLAMGMMEFSFVLYGDAVFGDAADPGTSMLKDVGRWFLGILALPVVLLLGVPLVKGALLDLKAGLVRMDGLILLAVLTAYGYSLFNTLRGDGPVYYETATMVLVLVMFGRRLEAHVRTQDGSAAEALLQCLPAEASRVLADGSPELVAPDALRAGDRVRILPGSAVPADVIVDTGASEVKAAHLTGEEALVPVGPGDAVPAGAVNGSGLLEARVEAPAKEGSLGRVLRLLEKPLPETRTLRLADRLAGWLAVIAGVLAIGGGLHSGLEAGVGAGIRTAMSVLLVSCPCALGLAVPLAYRALRTALTKHGVLVNDPTALEVAPSLRRVFLDKTGTLTTLEPGSLVPVCGREDDLERMSALILHSGHALAAALAPVQGAELRELRVTAGSGVTGVVNGVACRAGRLSWLLEGGARLSPSVASHLESAEAAAGSLVAYAEGDTVVALASARHELRPHAQTAIQALGGLGLAAEILSGDRESAVRPLAKELGIPARGALRPEDKVAAIHERRAGGERVLFAGDGVNDAAALRAADVGMAIASGTAAARSQAQIEIVGDDLRAIPNFVAGARALRRCVRGSLAWTLLYNGAALVIAALGKLHPLVAAAAMIVSSLAVSARSYRLLEWTPDPR